MAKYFILAFDGGGVRGYITASVLQKLLGDASVGNFLPQVSLLSGTSTGSFIALALAAGKDISTVQALYQQASAQTIFTPNPNIGSGDVARLEALRAAAAGAAAPAGLSRWWDLIVKYFDYLIYTSYTNTGVQSVAQQVLASKTLADLSPVLVNTLVLDDTSASPNAWTPTALSNLSGSTVTGMAAWEAGMCSGAAPIYFPPYSPQSASLGFCADGGLFANNPSMSAIAGALAQGTSLGDIYLLSLDTGTTADAMPASVIEGDWGGALSMGPLAWLSPLAWGTGTPSTPKFPLLSALMDASSASITQSAQALLGANFYRVSVPLSGPVALDDTSDAAYKTMDDSLSSFYSSSAYTAVTSWLQTNFPTG